MHAPTIDAVIFGRYNVCTLSSYCIIVICILEDVMFARPHHRHYYIFGRYCSRQHHSQE
jgi:hypothetical protein